MKDLKITFARNLKQHLAEGDKTQADLARYLHVSTAAVSDWANGNKMPRTDKIQSICNWLHIDLQDLLTEPQKDNVELPRKGVRIPVLGRVAAGIPIEAIEETIDAEEISEDLARRGTYFGLRIKGDSMSPHIMNGDTVIVRQQSDAETDDIVIAIVNGNDGVCKKLKKTSSGVMLISLNPVYDPIVFTEGEMDEIPVRIVGKVVELRRKI